MSLLCVGKGNDDWNQSAPHGAGRFFSRSAAKHEFTVEEFEKTMKEAGIIKILKPVYNFKATSPVKKE